MEQVKGKAEGRQGEVDQKAAVPGRETQILETPGTECRDVIQDKHTGKHG
jgi:hypothetical protein